MTTPRPKMGVITPVRGRLEHLEQQRRFLRLLAPTVQHYIVAVDTPDIEAGAATRVLHLPDEALGMPTAQARNVGAQAALDDECDFLIFLDVDCVPLPGFFERFRVAAERYGAQAALNAPTTYLPQTARLNDENTTTARRFINPHPVRPNPPEGAVELNNHHHLLWSLAFGITNEGWRRCGGFDERYVGYGAEDTDFGMRLRRAHLAMAWVGGAHVLHQWHKSANPPVHHLVDIARNAAIYRNQWGSWPMEGWLSAFACDGLIEWGATDIAITEKGYCAAASARS